MRILIKKSGFTLVELLIVIAIIAVLSIIGITIYSGIQKNARDSRRKADIDAITKAFEVKYNSTGTYGDLNPSLDENKQLFASKQFPKDPQGADYTIIKNPTTGGYRICSILEGNSQPACSAPSATCICKSSLEAEAPPASGGTAVTNPDAFAASPSDGPRIAIMQNVANALEQYRTTYGRYPKTDSGGDVGTNFPNCSNFPDWSQGGFAGLLALLISKGYISKPILDTGKDISCGGGDNSWGDLGKGATLGDAIVCGWDHCYIFDHNPWPAGYHYWSNGTNYKLILIQSDNSRYQLSK